MNQNKKLIVFSMIRVTYINDIMLLDRFKATLHLAFLKITKQKDK